MTREFVMTPVFDRLWTALGLDDDKLREFQNLLLDNPFAGDIIQGTGGARKTRFVLHSKGKSGGIRVIYVDITHRKQIYLVLCYPKSKQDDLTHEQKEQVKSFIKSLKGA